MARESFFDSKTAGGGRPQNETFPILVSGYDLESKPNTVQGTRMDTGEPVEVFLDPAVKSSGEFPRPTIAKFAAERQYKNDPGTLPGGILVVEKAKKQPDGKYMGRWLNVLSHNETEAEAIMATMYIHTPGVGKDKIDPETKKKGPGNAFCLATVVHDGDNSHLSDDLKAAIKWFDPLMVTTVLALEDALEERLTAGVGVGVRLRMPNENGEDSWDALEVKAFGDKSPEDAFHEIMGRFSDAFRDALESGKATCEVITHFDIWAGKMTAGTVLKEFNSPRGSFVQKYNGMIPGRDGQMRGVKVYRPTILGVRLTAPDPDTGERKANWTFIEPLMTRYPVAGIRNAIACAQTENFAPVVDKPDQQLLDSFSKNGPAAPTASEVAQGQEAADAAREAEAQAAPAAPEPAPAPVAVAAPAPAPAPAEAVADPVQSRVAKAERRFGAPSPLRR